jgi:hypothetical protein
MKSHPPNCQKMRNGLLKMAAIGRQIHVWNTFERKLFSDTKKPVRCENEKINQSINQFFALFLRKTGNFEKSSKKIVVKSKKPENSKYEKFLNIVVKSFLAKSKLEYKATALQIPRKVPLDK